MQSHAYANSKEPRMTCDLCNGPCFVLGQLGKLIHFRCRNCGANWSKTADPSLHLQDYYDGVEDGLEDAEEYN